MWEYARRSNAYSVVFFDAEELFGSVVVLVNGWFASWDDSIIDFGTSALVGNREAGVPIFWLFGSGVLVLSLKYGDADGVQANFCSYFCTNDGVVDLDLTQQPTAWLAVQ